MYKWRRNVFRYIPDVNKQKSTQIIMIKSMFQMRVRTQLPQKNHHQSMKGKIIVKSHVRNEFTCIYYAIYSLYDQPPKLSSAVQVYQRRRMYCSWYARLLISFKILRLDKRISMAEIKNWNLWKFSIQASSHLRIMFYLRLVQPRIWKLKQKIMSCGSLYCLLTHLYKSMRFQIVWWWSCKFCCS